MAGVGGVKSESSRIFAEHRLYYAKPDIDQVRGGLSTVPASEYAEIYS